MVSEMLMLLSLLVSNSGTISTHDYALISDGTSTSSSFTEIAGDSKPHTVLNCPDGFIEEQVAVFKHAYTQKSDLYLYKVIANFVPGHAARTDREKQPNGNDYNDTYLGTGFLHVAALQYKGQEYGGEITYKDMTPSSTKATTTITSTYSESVSTELDVGAEIGVDDSGTLYVKGSETEKVTVTYTHSESVSTKSDDPVLSATFKDNESTGKTEARWWYESKNPKELGNRTFKLTAYLLFEMSNNVSYFNRDVFQSYIHYSFTCKKINKFLWIENLADSTTYTAASGGNYFM